MGIPGGLEADLQRLARGDGMRLRAAVAVAQNGDHAGLDPQQGPDGEPECPKRTRQELPEGVGSRLLVGDHVAIGKDVVIAAVIAHYDHGAGHRAAGLGVDDDALHGGR